MKKLSSRMHLRRNKRRKGDTEHLAAQLAPLEELDRRSAEQQLGADRDYGAIIVDNQNLNVPKGIMEARDEKRILGLEPVVLVVLIIMLGYIAFIAWQISLLPAR